MYLLALARVPQSTFSYCKMYLLALARVPKSSFPIVKCTFWRSQGGAQRAAFLPRPARKLPDPEAHPYHPSGSTQRRWFPTCLGEAIPTRRTPFPLRPAHLARRCRGRAQRAFRRQQREQSASYPAGEKQAEASFRKSRGNFGAVAARAFGEPFGDSSARSRRATPPGEMQGKRRTRATSKQRTCPTNLSAKAGRAIGELPRRQESRTTRRMRTSSMQKAGPAIEGNPKP